MAKEKEKLISDFEKSFKKKELVDSNQLIEELFPEGKELSEKDTKLKKEIEDLIAKMNSTTPNIRKITNESLENSKMNKQEK